jgi:hypothetical protein
MTTSNSGSGLSSPMGSERIAPGTLGYFQARNKHNAYDLVMEEFTKSGLSQADLARRLGKGTDQICRLLGGPGNWTLDTLSDLMFAISGAAPTFGVDYPLQQPLRNQRGPDWLYDEVRSIPTSGKTRQQSVLQAAAERAEAFNNSGPLSAIQSGGRAALNRLHELKLLELGTPNDPEAEDRSAAAAAVAEMLPREPKARRRNR